VFHIFFCTHGHQPNWTGSKALPARVHVPAGHGEHMIADVTARRAAGLRGLSLEKADINIIQ